MQGGQGCGRNGSASLKPTWSGMPILVLVTVSAYSDRARKLVRSAALLFDVPVDEPADPTQANAKAAQLAVRSATDRLNEMWNLEETATGLIVKHLIVPSKPPWAQFRAADWHLPGGVEVWVK
jgi:hypothetical protein